MSYFLSSENLELNKTLTLTGEEAGHILLSRRIKPGEHINLQGPNGKRFETEVLTAKKNQLEIKALAEIPTPPEPKVNITLFQAVVSEKALDFIFQKSTELGAHKIVLFNSAHTATKLTSDQFKKKYDRWNKILWEAAKQSDRIHPPELTFTTLVDEEISKLEKTYLLDPSGTPFRDSVNSQLSIVNYGILVGPEGGFTAEEVNIFKSLPNTQTVSLGPIILRAETAVLAATTIILN